MTNTRPRLGSYFVYESFDEKRALFFNKGSVGFVLYGWPLVGASLEDQGEISEFIKDENNLPGGALFQVIMVGSRHIEPILQSWTSSRKGPMFQKMALKRKAFFEEYAQKGHVRDVFLWISLTFPVVDPSPSDLEMMVKRKKALMSTLRAMGLIAQEVGPSSLVEGLRLFFGWESSSHPPLNPFATLGEQILPPHFSCDVKQDHLLFHHENKALVTLSAAKRPTQWSLSNMDLFLGNPLDREERIPCEFIHCLNVRVLPRQAFEISKAYAKRESLIKNMKSGLLKWMTDLDEAHTDMGHAIVGLQEGDRVVSIHQTTVLKDDTHRIAESTAATQAMMRRHGFYFYPCVHDHLPVLMSCLPMAGVCERKRFLSTQKEGLLRDLEFLGRGLKTLSGETKALLPLLGEWKGDSSSPGMLLQGRRGQIMTWSPFGSVLIPQDKKAPQSNENFNLCIAGVPGSGKSVFMQELMLNILGVGGKVFVLDYGRSFKRICRLLGGHYIEFDLQNPFSVNPFSSLPQDPKRHEEKEDMLSSISAVLNTMAAPLRGTTDLQNALLQKALRASWNAHKNTNTISHIASWLLSQEETVAKDLGHALFPFTQEGIYGPFFEGPAELSLNHHIVVIETDHLRNTPALLAVVVQMMIVHINQTMVRGKRKYPFLIMIDEAWKLLQGGASGDFIEESGRIARKYKGSITLATQQLTDYFRASCPAAEKAFENASWKAILKQNPETLRAMKSNPKLVSFVEDNWRLEFLQSIHSHPPHYSEVALYGPGIFGIPARLTLDPFTRLLTSTNAEDYDSLDALIHQGMTVHEAVDHLIKERGMPSGITSPHRRWG